jgi:hypothetical protein
MEFKAKVEKKEGGLAFLRTEDGQAFSLPADKLPSGASVGEDIYLSVGRQKGEDAAKDLLNEILNTSGD